MEVALTQLHRDMHLLQWSDTQILPGTPIRADVRQKMDQADVLVFLLSPDFLHSDECMNEWRYAKSLSESGGLVRRIPVVVRPCSWQDLLGRDDIKVLPDDGVSISEFANEDLAWMQVYEGIKLVLQDLISTFTPRDDFLKELDRTEFSFEDGLGLQDLFVFPRIGVRDNILDITDASPSPLTNEDELLNLGSAIIYGTEKSGKTSLARHLFKYMCYHSHPVLLIELGNAHGRNLSTLLRDTYVAEFTGDYDLWSKQKHKTLIIDDVSYNSRLPDMIEQAEKIFDRILVMCQTHLHNAYFIDDTRFANFRRATIMQLSRVQQEQLIRNRLHPSVRLGPITDGLVDRIENRVDSITISRRLLPRYPFYVLSIMQALETYMPTNFAVTSYAHCYQALILSRLHFSGISRTDEDVNICMNFLEKLAFALYKQREETPSEDFNFDMFLNDYKGEFYIKDYIISRLREPQYGFINDLGEFRQRFAYFYFLGKHLANNEIGDTVVRGMCYTSYKESSFLTLVFTAHHTNNKHIIENLLAVSLDTLDELPIVTLTADETNGFARLISNLPTNTLTHKSVQEARTEQRELIDVIEERQERQLEVDSIDDDFVEHDTETTVEQELANKVYRSLQNNNIMGHMLRNRYGSLTKSKIEEIVGTVAGSALRLAGLFLTDEQKLMEIAEYANSREENADQIDAEEIKELVRAFSLLWVLMNIEEAGNIISVPEIREAVETVVESGSSPAYDLIGYYSLLGSSESLTPLVRDELRRLLKRHSDQFIWRLLSMKTQSYMNTHRSSTPIEQSICASLGIRYRHRL